MISRKYEILGITLKHSKNNVNILHPSFKNVSFHFWGTGSFIRTGKISSSLCIENTHGLSSIAYNRAVNEQKLILSFMKYFIVLYLSRKSYLFKFSYILRLSNILNSKPHEIQPFRNTSRLFIFRNFACPYFSFIKMENT